MLLRLDVDMLMFYSVAVYILSMLVVWFYRVLGCLIMRLSSLGGAAYCVALCLSVCLSVRPVIVAIGNVFSSTASVTDVLFGTHCGHPYFSARTEGRISYGHLGRTNCCSSK